MRAIVTRMLRECLFLIGAVPKYQRRRRDLGHSARAGVKRMSFPVVVELPGSENCMRLGFPAALMLKECLSVTYGVSFPRYRKGGEMREEERKSKSPPCRKNRDKGGAPALLSHT